MKNEQIKMTNYLRDKHAHFTHMSRGHSAGKSVKITQFLSFFISDSLFVSLMEFVINLAAGGSI